MNIREINYKKTYLKWNCLGFSVKMRTHKNCGAKRRNPCKMHMRKYLINYENKLEWRKVNTHFCRITSPVNKIKRFTDACTTNIFMHLKIVLVQAINHKANLIFLHFKKGLCNLFITKLLFINNVSNFVNYFSVNILNIVNCN